MKFARAYIRAFFYLDLIVIEKRHIDMPVMCKWAGPNDFRFFIFWNSDSRNAFWSRTAQKSLWYLEYPFGRPGEVFMQGSRCPRDPDVLCCVVVNKSGIP